MKYHFNQKDKDGRRYIFHPLYVMFHVKEYKEKVVALLHDIVEDTNLTIDDLKKYKFLDDILFANFKCGEIVVSSFNDFKILYGC
jgi:(p)ppGpp synthase/HD superfamily hydrolase